MIASASSKRRCSQSASASGPGRLESVSRSPIGRSSSKTCRNTRSAATASPASMSISPCTSAARRTKTDRPSSAMIAALESAERRASSKRPRIASSCACASRAFPSAAGSPSTCSRSSSHRRSAASTGLGPRGSAEEPPIHLALEVSVADMPRERECKLGLALDRARLAPLIVDERPSIVDASLPEVIAELFEDWRNPLEVCQHPGRTVFRIRHERQKPLIQLGVPRHVRAPGRSRILHEFGKRGPRSDELVGVDQHVARGAQELQPNRIVPGQQRDGPREQLDARGGVAPSECPTARRRQPFRGSQRELAVGRCGRADSSR